jgi:hypothetical protein
MFYATGGLNKNSSRLIEASIAECRDFSHTYDTGDLKMGRDVGGDKTSNLGASNEGKSPGVSPSKTRRKKIDPCPRPREQMYRGKIRGSPDKMIQALLDTARTQESDMVKVLSLA